MNSNDATQPSLRLLGCTQVVWFLWNDLPLNADKSEVVILGTAPQLRSTAAISTIVVAGSTLQDAPELRSLGVTTSGSSHVREVARACNYHTRALRHVHRLLVLAFHDADTDTDTDTDSPNTATILRPTHAISSRGSRVGVVECQLTARGGSKGVGWGPRPHSKACPPLAPK